VLLPHTIRGIVAHGPLRDNFVRSAAILLCVPEKYTKLLAQLGQEITQTRRTVSYNEAQFGAAARLGVNEVACYLEAIGVTAEEAERWWPWAAAYVDMELEVQLNSYHVPKLQQARDAVHVRINADPKWVFKNIHPDTPGNYNPGHRQARDAARQWTLLFNSAMGMVSTMILTWAPSIMMYLWSEYRSTMHHEMLQASRPQIMSTYYITPMQTISCYNVCYSTCS
jgi:hypothetical protein